MTPSGSWLARSLAELAVPLTGERHDYDGLLDGVGDATLVLLGEASHGTHEFYRERAQITKRLIREKGFIAVAAEADWPDAYRVNRFVQGRSREADSVDALADLRRFPQWMWRNADVLDFVGWLRSHNDDLAAGAPRVGFYGLDLYGLHASMQAVLAYLDSEDPEAAARARQRYASFDDVGADAGYGYVAGLALSRSCEHAILAQLIELQQRRVELLARDGLVAEDEPFAAAQNARVVANAEPYYRGMFGGRVQAWNLRDTHMADTLDALAAHLGRRGPPKIVVWAHNSHLGDARATDAAAIGEINLGQLMRQRHGASVRNVGFLTYQGTVSAAPHWDAPVERSVVRPALDGSYEAVFHQTGLPRLLVDLRDLGEASGGLGEARLERAIGVVYKPESERLSHYFMAELPRQFDFVLHFEETRAVEPLERSASWEGGELPETYPFSV